MEAGDLRSQAPGITWGFARPLWGGRAEQAGGLLRLLCYLLARGSQLSHPVDTVTGDLRKVLHVPLACGRHLCNSPPLSLVGLGDEGLHRLSPPGQSTETRTLLTSPESVGRFTCQSFNKLFLVTLTPGDLCPMWGRGWGWGLLLCHMLLIPRHEDSRQEGRDLQQFDRHLRY